MPDKSRSSKRPASKKTPATDQGPWYRDGLRFECTACGNCCTGDPGYVWVNKAEIHALAKRIGQTDVDRFEREYVRQVGIRKSLKEFPNGDCVFFDAESRKCTVYEDRPRQCRTWPFWDSNVRDPQRWQQTCAICPGSGQGRLYSIEEIDARSSVIHL